MIFGIIGLNPLCSPHAPPGGRPCRGWGYPKMKIEIIFEIPTIENPKIDITLDFWWYTPSGPQAPPLRGRPYRGWGYPKMEIEIIFEIPTIENPRIDITHDLW